MGEHLAAHMLNFVILTATLSVYNSMVYSSSRLLYGMAQEGNAPKSLAEVNKRGVPVKAIVYPGIVTAFCVVLNYVAPAGVIELLISLITAALVIIWTIIIISHLNYRKLHDAKGTPRSFKAPLFPLTNYICLVAMVLVAGGVGLDAAFYPEHALRFGLARLVVVALISATQRVFRLSKSMRCSAFFRVRPEPRPMIFSLSSCR